MDNRQKRPLHWAADYARGNTAILEQLLVECGALVNVQDEEGATPLHLAVYRGDKQAAVLLLSHGADCRVTDGDGDTALHYATAFYSRKDSQKVEQETIAFELTECLLMAAVASGGANAAASLVNQQNHQGEAALHIAARNGMREVVHLLREYGADASLVDRHGCTPLECANRRKRGALADLLAGTRQGATNADPGPSSKRRLQGPSSGPSAAKSRGSRGGQREAVPQPQRQQQGKRQVEPEVASAPALTVTAGSRAAPAAPAPATAAARLRPSPPPRATALPAPPALAAAVAEGTPAAAPAAAAVATTAEAAVAPAAAAQLRPSPPRGVAFALPVQAGLPAAGATSSRAAAAVSVRWDSTAGGCVVAVNQASEAEDQLDSCFFALQSAGWEPVLQFAGDDCSLAELYTRPPPAAAPSSSIETLLVACQGLVMHALRAQAPAGSAEVACGDTMPPVKVGSGKVTIQAAPLLASSQRYQCLAVELEKLLGAAGGGWRLYVAAGRLDLELAPGVKPSPTRVLRLLQAALQ